MSFISRQGMDKTAVQPEGRGSGKWDRTIVVGVKDRCTTIVLYRCILYCYSLPVNERGMPLFRMYAHYGRLFK